MKINITELKNKISKINMAIEKSKLNPQAGWIELETVDNYLNIKVANTDYCLNTKLYIEQLDDFIHATVLAETFIPLISKLDNGEADLVEKLNSIVLETDKSTYNFPVIKELGVTKKLDIINFNSTDEEIEIDFEKLVSIAIINTGGLHNALFSRELQQYIYVDEEGAITFTENIYVNNFENNTPQFKFLLTGTQAKLLKIFENEFDLKMQFEKKVMYNTTATNSNKVKIYNDNIELILITQPQDMVDAWPSMRIRAIANNDMESSVTLDRRELLKALNRLMVFDKKFDITVMDYSKIKFTEEYLELISTKNNNIEKIPYITTDNIKEYEAVIRFADLLNQVKVVTDKELNIFYGNGSAVVLNSTFKQVIPEIKVNKVEY